MHHSLNMDPTTLKGIEMGDNAQIVRKKIMKGPRQTNLTQKFGVKKIDECCTLLYISNFALTASKLYTR